MLCHLCRAWPRSCRERKRLSPFWLFLITYICRNLLSAKCFLFQISLNLTSSKVAFFRRWSNTKTVLWPSRSSAGSQRACATRAVPRRKAAPHRWYRRPGAVSSPEPLRPHIASPHLDVVPRMVVHQPATTVTDRKSVV